MCLFRKKDKDLAIESFLSRVDEEREKRDHVALDISPFFLSPYLPDLMLSLSFRKDIQQLNLCNVSPLAFSSCLLSLENLRVSHLRFVIKSSLQIKGIECFKHFCQADQECVFLIERRKEDFSYLGCFEPFRERFDWKSKREVGKEKKKGLIWLTITKNRISVSRLGGDFEKLFQFEMLTNERLPVEALGWRGRKKEVNNSNNYGLIDI